jgi:hypothetical protein
LLVVLSLCVENIWRSTTTTGMHRPETQVESPPQLQAFAATTIVIPKYTYHTSSVEYLHYSYDPLEASGRGERVPTGPVPCSLWFHVHWISMRRPDRCSFLSDLQDVNDMMSGQGWKVDGGSHSNNNTDPAAAAARRDVLTERFRPFLDSVDTRYTVQVLITDSSDLGGGRTLIHCARDASAIVGPHNVYLASRALVVGRDYHTYFDLSRTDGKLLSEEKILSMPFRHLNGTVWDYTSDRAGSTNVSRYVHNGIIAKHDFEVRAQLKWELDQHILALQRDGDVTSGSNNNNNSSSSSSSSHQQQQQQNPQGGEDTAVSVEDYFRYSRRTMDVAHFWDVEPGDPYGQLRNRVTQTLRQMMTAENVTGTAGLVSERRAVGRRSVAAGYVRALARHKIVVVAQRDQWEDHLRLYEALISGALVLSDPITHMPCGLADGTSIVIYHSLDDLRSKVRYYLTKGRGRWDRLGIAQAGMRAALDHHSPGSHMARLMVGRWPDDLRNPVLPALTGSFFFSTNRTVQ